MNLVVGLGNPGRRYARTRHNVGFLVVERLAQRWGGSVTTKQFGALVERIQLHDVSVVLAKPQSYMNLSGQPVASLRGYYKTPVDGIVVVHDEIDLAFGQVRVKRGGGHGGHNGLRDVTSKLGSNGYLRIRCGVSRPPPGWDTADYVLGKWTEVEVRDLSVIIECAADAVEHVVAHGVADAMNIFNVRPKPDSGTSAKIS